MLTSITALSGKPVHNAGDAVEKGDLLISGSLGNGIYVEARGEATARVLHRASHTAGWVQRLKRPSGESQSCLWIQLRGRDILPMEPPYEEYELTEERRTTFTSILPIVICRAQCRELTYATARADEEELRILAERGAKAALEDMLPEGAGIISASARYTQDENGLTCAIDAVVHQNIAIIGELVPDESDAQQPGKQPGD